MKNFGEKLKIINFDTVLMIKAIHIILDEKFIDGAIAQFEKIENISSRYLYYRPVVALNLVHIEYGGIEYCKTKKQLRQVLLFSDYNILFLHSMTLSTSLILSIPKKIKIVWITWGWDIYSERKWRVFSSLPIQIDLYKPLTAKYLSTNLQAVLEIIFNGLYFFYRKKIQYHKIISRMDFCSTILPIERGYLLKYVGFHAKPFVFNYPNKENFVENPNDLAYKFNNNNILIGNSATPENNHLDIIEQIELLNLYARKIILPLNYGNKGYPKRILREIKKSQWNYVPILNFMPYKAYSELVRTCSHVIMGNIRQQAMGNIFMALAQGAKVFLYEDSLMFDFLKSLGCYIYSIQKDLSQEQLLNPLTDEQIIQNRIIVHNYVSPENRFKNLNLSVEAVINSIAH